jgi:hypothetical protein
MAACATGSMLRILFKDIAPQAGAGHIEVRQHIAKPGRQQLHALELAAQEAHGQVAGQCVLAAQAGDQPGFFFKAHGRCALHGRAGDAVPEVAQHMPAVADQCFAQRLFIVVATACISFIT